MIFVDSAFLLALVNPRDSLYSRAQAWVRAVQEPLLVTEYVLWEVVNSLSSPADRPKAHAVVSRIWSGSDWEVVPASPDLFEAGMRLHRERADKAWSLTDCISFHIMESRQLTRALTYDSHFEQAGFQALLRSEPS